MNLFFYSNDAEISNKVVANGEYIFFGDLIQKKNWVFQTKENTKLLWHLDGKLYNTITNSL